MAKDGKSKCGKFVGESIPKIYVLLYLSSTRAPFWSFWSVTAPHKWILRNTENIDQKRTFLHVTSCDKLL